MMLGWSATAGGQPQEEDRDLMRRTAAGDERAFERLYDRYSHAVFAVLLRMLRDRQAAEDLTQEVFVKLWRTAGQFEPAAASALPWLIVVARHAALDRLRGADARRQRCETDAALETLAISGDTQTELRIWEQECMMRVRAVMGRLSSDERQVIELAYFEELTQQQISERCGRPLGTVKSWMRTGLGKLRAGLL